MPVKIRLQRHGRSKRPFYHIIIADSRNSRDGKFIERIGDYNPLTIPATINLDVDKAFEWIMNGAQPTNTVKKVLTFKGVLYKKHLQRGVTKGAFDQAEADKRFVDWAQEKVGKVQARMEKELLQIEDKRNKRNTDEATKRSAKMVAKEEAVAAAVAEAEAEIAAENAEEVSSADTAAEDTAAEDTASDETNTEETTEE